MTAKNMKLLASGDIRGNWGPFLKRLESVNKKAGPFEFVICAGSAFRNGESDETWERIRAGKVKVPMTVFLLGPNTAKEQDFFDSPTGSELAENVVYLGKTGCYSTKEGLKIAYFSGVPSASDPFGFSHKDFQDIEAKLGWNVPGYKGVDILLTSEWPMGITEGAAPVEGIYSQETGSKIISRLALCCKPRYHFAALHGKHYERVPYRNHKVLAERVIHVTRFVSLAPVGNVEKAKWLYAFNVTPLDHMSSDDLNKQPDFVTDVPFKKVHLSENSSLSSGQFFFDMKAAQEMGNRDNKKRRKGSDFNDFQKKSRSELKDSCWFCLSGSDVEKHLVVSVGEHSYLALPKGGLTSDHVLVLPISHHPSSLELPEEVAGEIQKFKKALKDCYYSQDKAVVFYERFFKCYHMQLQCVPIPMHLKDNIVPAFINAKDICGVEITPIPPHASLTQMVEPGKPFFYVETSEGDRLFHGVRSGFNLNFGRDVLGSPALLDISDRIDWRKCKLDAHEETELTKKFRNLFKPYDFTIDDSDDE